MTAVFNKLLARKEIGAIHTRLREKGLERGIRRQIIRRHLSTLLDTLPAKFHGIVNRCFVALSDGNQLELVAGVCLLDSLIPLTYGSIPAGTVFKYRDVFCTKRKEGCEYRGNLGIHLHPSTRVTVVNLENDHDC